MSLLVNQPPADPGGWRFQLFACFGEKEPYWLQTYTLGPPVPTRPSGPRVVCSLCVPGARCFQCIVEAPIPAPPVPIEAGLVGDGNCTPNVTNW